MFDFTNFSVETEGNWTTCSQPSSRADFKSDVSRYWNLGNGVIRKSNHWGVVGNCFWKINGKPKQQKALIKSQCGFILYEDLRRIV